MAHKIVTWVLVADGERARILANRGPNTGLEPVLDELQNPRSAADHYRDEPARVHQRVGPGRAAVTPRVDWHQFEKARFARDLTRMLKQKLEEHRIDRLVLCAPPRILGDLRAAFDEQLRELVIGEVDKDLTHLDDAAIGRHLDGIIVV